jgi:hypothetical protein
MVMVEDKVWYSLEYYTHTKTNSKVEVNWLLRKDG